MTKLEHLQFLALMIPTFLILGAAAVSLADLGVPASEAAPMTVAMSAPIHPGELACAGNPFE